MVREPIREPILEFPLLSEPISQYRLQLDFSEEAFKEVVELRMKLGVSSHGEVIRNALGLLKWAVNHIENGDKIIVERNNGEMSQIEFSFLNKT